MTAFSQIGIPKTIKIESDTFKCFDVSTTKRIIKDLIRGDSAYSVSKLQSDQLRIDSLINHNLKLRLDQRELELDNSNNIITLKTIENLELSDRFLAEETRLNKRIKVLTVKNRITTYVTLGFLSGIIFSTIVK